LSLKNPTLTISIPTLNRALQVERSVELINKSVYYQQIEIIIADDGSDQLNRTILQRVSKNHSNVRLLINDINIGMTNNWNRSIECACGEWVCLLCDDDFFKETAIDTIFNYISKITQPILIIQNPLMQQDEQWLNSGAEATKTIDLPPASGQVWHRSILTQLGGYDTRIKYCPDDEFWQRIAYHFPVLRVKEEFVIHRQHENNYMWQIFAADDFIEQIELSLRLRSRWYLGDSYCNSQLMNFEILNGLWETLRTVINNTLFKKNKMKNFSSHLYKFLLLSLRLNRKKLFFYVLARAIAVRLYSPFRPWFKLVK
jgi:glycosyltransferase involved in cell wall biosynthesis